VHVNGSSLDVELVKSFVVDEVVGIESTDEVVFECKFCDFEMGLNIFEVL